MKFLKIGQVAKQADVKIETIRYYENLRLLPQPKRHIESGYRLYDASAIVRLRFIKNAKELGFSLKEITELFALKRNARSTCATVKKRTEKKIEEINHKIKALQKIKKSLIKLSSACQNNSLPLSECPILDEFEKTKGKTENESK